jgi:hypothetical protein
MRVAVGPGVRLRKAQGKSLTDVGAAAAVQLGGEPRLLNARCHRPERAAATLSGSRKPRRAQRRLANWLAQVDSSTLRGLSLTPFALSRDARGSREKSARLRRD